MMAITCDHTLWCWLDVWLFSLSVHVLILHCPRIDTQTCWNVRIGVSSANAKEYSMAFLNFWENELHHGAFFSRTVPNWLLALPLDSLNLTFVVSHSPGIRWNNKQTRSDSNIRPYTAHIHLGCPLLECEYLINVNGMKLLTCLSFEYSQIVQMDWIPMGIYNSILNLM